MFDSPSVLTRRQLLGATSVALVASGLGCGNTSADRKPESKPDDAANRPLPSIDALSVPWESTAEVDWPITAILGQMATDVYLTPDEAAKAFKTMGFETVTPFSVASMVGAVAALDDTVVVSFRGTDELEDWLANLDIRSKSISGGKIHAGFHNAYGSLRADVRRALTAAAPRHLWITGHSLGGALSVVCALDLVQDPVATVKGVVTFGQPMIAKPDLARQLDDSLAGIHQRFVNGADVVARIPPGYVHTGNRVWFGEDGVVTERLRAFGAPADDGEPGPEESPRPLSMAEFEELQADLRRTENVDEVEPQQLRTFGGNLPWLRDHGMEHYLQQINSNRSAP
jgi:triacylglycerol lipase